MKAVILAAGKGSRLYPITKAIAKPLLPIANRMTLEYAFDQFHECGIHEACIVVGENESDVKKALGDGSAFSLKLSYVRQPEARGLAHAVGFAREFVGSDSFMLYLGDAIYTESLKPYVAQFQQGGAANLNLVKWVEDPRRFGVANIVDGRIVKLVEKPQNPETNWAMAGVYLFGPELWEVLADLKPSWRNEYEITDAIQLLVDRGYRVVPGEFSGEWFDTGTLDSFLETSSWMTRGSSLIAPDAHVEAEVVGHVVAGAGARIKAKSISDAVILPGSHVVVEGDISRCILGGDIHSAESIEGLIRYGSLE